MGSDRPPEAESSTPPRFEEALGRLEALVGDLESGDLSLEDSIARFEEGQRLLNLCTTLLEGAELRVREVLRKADGGLESRELDLEEGESA
ncbi:MAG: exodeoxyribonuclease VII small subunit [Candidatus Eisenbacteria bacterium]|uniref:Exodeoxyribonuclease 7 small subunit n=1 Tax=Eiseniibacteriota bacterium TaxID=2212470 RepID=A0A956LZ30_UNCEI|nr:exodeoxyribonuclease VII small subunit [Candidatus Eisenbacteria bacterium]